MLNRREITLLIAIFTALLLSVIFGEGLLTTISLLIMIIVGFITYIIINSRVKKLLTGLSESIDEYRKPFKPKYLNTLSDSLISKIEDQINTLFSEIKLIKERSEEEKDEITTLLSDISHQIKTPLTQLNIYNELLNREFSQEILDQQNKALSDLTWLIEKLMKFSRIEAGIININKISSSITKTMLNTLIRIKPLADKKSIEIKLDSSDENIIPHDYNWSQEAIFNILDNAVKYSPDKSTIYIKSVETDLFYGISIIDEGTGIHKEELNSLYERFYRGENSRTIDGVGIGLSLTEKIMTLQGGYIHGESKVGEGSKFTLYFPKSI